jgi:CRISPR system Cascade subunit CasE
MYLSRLILNPRSRRVQKELSDPYQMHRSIMRAFPDDLESGEERVLFRVDTPRGGGRLTLLVQSQGRPDWSWLAQDEGARGYLLETEEPNPWVKEFAPQFNPGQVLAFRLRANPTIKRKGKRLGLYRDEEQISWLTRKAEQSGFRLLSVRTANATILGGVAHRDSTDDNLRLLSVQFDGLLEVQNAELLRLAARDGIGSGKGFGLGLLSLARAV